MDLSFEGDGTYLETVVYNQLKNLKNYLKRSKDILNS